MTPELAVTAYLQDHGFPSAEATMHRGISGTGRLYWHVTDRAAEHVSDSLISDWLSEAYVLSVEARADLGILVTPRDAYGTARVASWWAHVDVRTLSRAMRGALVLPDTVSSEPFRMHLSTAVLLTRAAGYGTPLGMGEAA